MGLREQERGCHSESPGMWPGACVAWVEGQNTEQGSADTLQVAQRVSTALRIVLGQHSMPRLRISAHETGHGDTTHHSQCSSHINKEEKKEGSRGGGREEKEREERESKKKEGRKSHFTLCSWYY